MTTEPRVGPIIAHDGARRPSTSSVAAAAVYQDGSSGSSSHPNSAISTPPGLAPHGHALYSATAIDDQGRSLLAPLVQRSQSDGAIDPHGHNILPIHRPSLPTLNDARGLTQARANVLADQPVSLPLIKRTAFSFPSPHSRSPDLTNAHSDHLDHRHSLSDSDASAEWHQAGFQTPPTPGDCRPFAGPSADAAAHPHASAIGGLAHPKAHYLQQPGFAAPSFAHLSQPVPLQHHALPPTMLVGGPQQHQVMHHEDAHRPAIARRVTVDNGYQPVQHYAEYGMHRRASHDVMLPPPAVPISGPSGHRHAAGVENGPQHAQGSGAVYSSTWTGPVAEHGALPPPPGTPLGGAFVSPASTGPSTGQGGSPESPPQSPERHQREMILAPHIKQYLYSPNRFLLGERTVLVMTSKIGQKSYGAEKRFLCPPPAALLLGCSWWSAGLTDQDGVALDGPYMNIKIDAHHEPEDMFREWMTMNGRGADARASVDDPPIAGRATSKGLFVASANEKTKRVRALVYVGVPMTGAPAQNKMIGYFPSKPIKVISKPSKKRQSVKTVDPVLGIHHGSTISLLNRLRSQTCSTKYLCISGQPASFPASDWRAMSGQETKPFALHDTHASFIARTCAWDPFIIYLVDPLATGTISSVPFLPGYPRPPTNALPLPPGSAGNIPVFFNQPVVLQCLSTGVVSPIMIIRQVIKNSTVCGGTNGNLESTSPVTDSESSIVAPGEMLGDMVCSLNKIAFEVMRRPEDAYSRGPRHILTGFPDCGQFLACLGENVGIHPGLSERELADITPPPSSRSATSEVVASLSSMTSASPTVSLAGGAASRRSSTTLADYEAANSTVHGGKDRRGLGGSPTSRRSSAADPYARPDRNGYHQAGQTSDDELGGSPPQAGPSSQKVTATEKYWQADCGEPAVWQIVGCDIQRHTFYVPSVLGGGSDPSTLPPSNQLPPSMQVGNVHRTPVPDVPIGDPRCSPIPSLIRLEKIEPVSADRPNPWITLVGHNLRPDIWVWFHEYPAPDVIRHSDETVEAQVPDIILDSSPPHIQIILVRDDGVVFPSSVFFDSRSFS